MDKSSISDRWTTFLNELENTCEELNRGLPKIVVVSKTRSDEEIIDAIDLGIMDFGENLPQEFQKRVDRFPQLSWHFIGHLQSRKTKLVAPHATTIHSLDRKKLVDSSSQCSSITLHNSTY